MYPICGWWERARELVLDKVESLNLEPLLCAVIPKNVIVREVEPDEKVDNEPFRFDDQRAQFLSEAPGFLEVDLESVGGKMGGRWDRERERGKIYERTDSSSTRLENIASPTRQMHHTTQHTTWKKIGNRKG